MACYCPGVASGATPAEVRAWAAENGFDVPDKGRLGSDVKDAYTRAHNPDPDTDSGTGAAESNQDPVDFAADPEPQQPKGGASRVPVRRPVKVTAAIRADIEAKVALMLTFPAAAWAARDPFCGRVAVDVVPPTSSALADIFCGSPDAVAFFTTTGGDYMKWLQLMTALQPLAVTYYQHHIGHTIGQDDSERGGPSGGYVPPDMSAFHAPNLG